MYIDKKYFSAFTGDIDEMMPQKFYVDWYYLKPNLKRYYKTSHEFVFEIGIAGKRLSINVKWGYRSRPMNEREKEREERTKKFIKELNKGEE